MKNKNNYELILNKLQKGSVDDWEYLSQQFSDFPDGVDDFVERAWIINAIDYSLLEVVKWMIFKNVNLNFVDEEGYSPLHSCLDLESSDKYEILQLLIDSGAYINIGTELGKMAISGWSPLHMAAARNDIAAIQILLCNGAKTQLKTIIDSYVTAEEEAVLLGNNEAARIIQEYMSLNNK